MSEFLERPAVYTTIVWAMYLVPSLGLIYWFIKSDRRQKQRDEERRKSGEKVPKRGFFDSPEVGDFGPRTKFALTVTGFVGVVLAGYWCTTTLWQEFADLESGKVQSIKVHSVIAWAYNALGRYGAVGLTAGLFLVVLCSLGDDIWDSYLKFKAGRSLDRGDSRQL